MGSRCSSCCSRIDIVDTVFSYSTVKIVSIHDFRLGLIHRLLQVLLLLYFLVYVLIIQEKYWTTESAFGDAMTKMHGVAPVNITYGNQIITTMDTAEDLVVPSSENNALFIVSRYAVTSDQRVSTCDYPEFVCTHDDNCTGWDKTKQVSLKPGTCQPNNRCRYEFWCPQEDPDNDLGLDATADALVDPSGFTIWVKAAIQFPDLKPGVVYNTINQKYPRMKANYPDTYNLFPVSDLLSIAHIPNDATLLKEGAIIELAINWKCDLNFWTEKDDACKLDYTAERLDIPKSHTGFNYRTTEKHFNANGTLERTLIKYYGLRIILTSKGIGYKLSPLDLVLQLSSLAALLVVATTVVDLVISFILKRYLKIKRDETESYLNARQREIEMGSDVEDDFDDVDDEDDDGEELRDGDRSRGGRRGGGDVTRVSDPVVNVRPLPMGGSGRGSDDEQSSLLGDD